jgi:aspartate aminotransferase-like enzyme
MVSEKVRHALLHPEMCHTVPGFANVIQNVQSKLLKVYKANEN